MSVSNPSSIETEQSVLGLLLLNPDLIVYARSELQSTDFWRAAHQYIFQAIMLVDSADAVTVSSLLESQQKLSKVGGAAYITELTGTIANPQNLDSYIEILREKALLRKLLLIGSRVMEQSQKEQMPAMELAEKVQAEMAKVTERATKSDFTSMNTLMSEVFDHLSDGENASIAAMTGLLDLDNILNGFHKGDLVVIAARPSMGKTCLAMNFAVNAMKQDKSVAVISLEMSGRQLAERMVSELSGVEASKMRRVAMDDNDVKAVSDAIETLSKAPIYVEDGRASKVPEIQAMCRTLKSQGKLDLIIVDYIQLMNPVYRSDSRVQEISEITRGLKKMAMELDVPVVALSQLSRNIESRKDKRPQLHDLRDSGSIEQDADVVMFIYRENYYNKSKGENEAEILIRKHRNGPIGNIKLYFDAETQRFRNHARI